MEPQPEEMTNVEPETQPEKEEQTVEERTTKRKRTVEQEKKGENEEEEGFVFAETRSFWNIQLAEKGFIGDRGFWKPISPFAELIEKRGWEFFC